MKPCTGRATRTASKPGASGALVGGLYGVTIGRMFFGESMFARETDASKVALAKLVAMLRAMRMPLIDCQQETEHLAGLGAPPDSAARSLPTGWRGW